MGLCGSVSHVQLKKTCFAVPNQVSFFPLPWFCSLLKKWQCLLTVLEARGTGMVMNEVFKSSADEACGRGKARSDQGMNVSSDFFRALSWSVSLRAASPTVSTRTVPPRSTTRATAHTAGKMPPRQRR